MTCDPITLEGETYTPDLIHVLYLALRVIIDWLLGLTYSTWVFDFLGTCTP